MHAPSQITNCAIGRLQLHIVLFLKNPSDATFKILFEDCIIGNMEGDAMVVVRYYSHQ